MVFRQNVHVFEVDPKTWTPEQGLGVDPGYIIDGNRMLNELMSSYRDNPTTDRYFLLWWTGTPIPTGAEIDGRIVGNQIGDSQLSDASGQQIGTFVRLVNGGDDGMHYKMLVTVPVPAMKNVDNSLIFWS